MQIAISELALTSKDKKTGCIFDPLIADKTLRETIVGVSAVTWWHWRKQGRLPKSLTIGRRRFYRSSDIAAWLDEMVSVEAAR